MSNGIAPSYIVARRRNHTFSSAQSDSASPSPSHLSSVNTKPTKNKKHTAHQKDAQPADVKHKGETDTAATTKIRKVKGTQDKTVKVRRGRANRRLAAKLTASVAPSQKSKPGKVATDLKSIPTHNTEETIRNIAFIQKESSLGLKKIRPSKVIAALSLAPQVLKKTARKPTAEVPTAETPKPSKLKAGSGGFAPVRLATTKLQDEATLKDIEILPLNTESDEVPGLSYGLDRVLFNPGVYQLQDNRTMVYNFDPYLADIMPVSQFDFKALNDYITSSKDEVLKNKAIEAGKKYIGSSSSMTGVLSHFHFLLSEWREIDTSHLTQGFPPTLKSFTKLSRLPAVVFLRYNDGVYAIDADKEWDNSNILMGLGKSMEKLLTMPTDQFERYRRSNPDKILKEDSPPEVYHYSTCGDFLMRSQLDAYDPRLPGTGMFDLKTRAVVSIRMDAREPWDAMGYQIKSRLGEFESFEREYYDMMRSAFLKYHLQVRVGRMDGIFVAFHNIKRIFGFQYISLPEMDKCIHGQENTALGDAEFKLSINLWNRVLDMATEKYPKQSLRFHFETRESQNPFMYIFAEPVTDEEITKIQERNIDEIQAYEKRVFYPELLETTEPKAASSEEGNSAVQASESTEHSSDCASEDELGDKVNAETTELAPRRLLLAMALSIRNFVNGKEVERPTEFTSRDEWTVKYQISSFTEERGWALYEACKQRRSRALSNTEDDDAPNSRFLEQLKAISKNGQKWRDRMDKIEKKNGIIRY
ncbi:mitochondrial membrane protein [Arthroderma uncinatum]|uniref:mitochondrial membrane protein n=1 Tax=Arthroderma uncinatum TaxID=74035 RepID=UPI00144A677C|nr:mitochondrial membrane protein [Arthroderma uncinatum]KAF3483732.1 mitochondrial membrane protein [Arthroderma uncinatum]